MTLIHSRGIAYFSNITIIVNNNVDVPRSSNELERKFVFQKFFLNHRNYKKYSQITYASHIYLPTSSLDRSIDRSIKQGSTSSTSIPFQQEIKHPFNQSSLVQKHFARSSLAKTMQDFAEQLPGNEQLGPRLFISRFTGHEARLSDPFSSSGRSRDYQNY